MADQPREYWVFIANLKFGVKYCITLLIILGVLAAILWDPVFWSIAIVLGAVVWLYRKIWGYND
jgi:hypothetical protein